MSIHKGYPILGHIPLWIFDRLKFLEQCAASDRTSIELRLIERGLLINCHQDVRHILYANYQNYVKNSRLTDRRGQQLFGEGVQTQTTSSYRQQRRQIQPAFISNEIAVFAPQVVTMTQTRVATWSDGTEINIAKEILQLVHCIMGKILFNLDFEYRDRAFGETILYRRQQVNRQFSLPIPLIDYLNKPSNIFQLGALPKIEAEIDRMIQARQNNTEGERDLLSAFVQMQLKAETNLTDKQVRDEALGTSGGYETISAVLIWTLYLLALHPQIESKLLQELDLVLADSQSDRQNYSFDVRDIPRLRYTKMVLDESLRLYPPTWIFTRTAQESDNLPSGLTLTKGSKIYLSPYLLHRHPGYFANPNQFEPERFNEKNKQLHPQFAYFPFGGGMRLCIGQPLVEMMTVLMLATIVRQIRLQLSPGQTIVPQPNITLLPKKGLKMQIQIRCLEKV